MAESATFCTFLFLALVLFTISGYYIVESDNFYYACIVITELPMKAEAKFCERPSGTWLGVCGNSGKCKDQCIRLEGAKHGSRNYRFPAHRCICYYEC
ncbi:hypothetical protein ACHQM5_001507 [Ranunculus cassubicifolius]